MEKRLLLAIALSFLVLVLYQAIFVKKVAPPEPEAKPSLPEAQEIRRQEPAPQETSPSPEPSPRKDIQPTSGLIAKEIVVKTPLYTAVWSNRGALLKSWKLKKFLDDNGAEVDLVSGQSAELKKYPLALSSQDPEFDQMINNSLFKTSALELNLKDGERGEIRFQFADVKGNLAEKILLFWGGKYSFEIQIQVKKQGRSVKPGLLWGPGFSSASPPELSKKLGESRGIAVSAAQKIYRMEEKKFKPEANAFNFVSWAAYEDNYFTALFLTSPPEATAAFLKEEKDKLSYFYLSVFHPQQAYLGPKDIDALKELGGEAKRLINFGFFGFIAEILLYAIKAIHKLVPNWGVSIIILTIVIKILFFPLTLSSTRSMAKMQELQPKIKALRAKYKKAKQDIAQRRKMNEEIMQLYKEQGVNPAGGCLPMLIQLPIFWGFFRMLLISIEFRKSPFIFWIKDLSAKDPYYVTPILMGITQFISQKMTPTSADPSQQRIMLIMPVIMTVIFMSFQSGLILYWLTNNILQIGQQYIMNRFIHKKQRESHGKRRKK